MNIVKSYVTKNQCYNDGRALVPKGLMLHSIGCPQPKAQILVNNYNNATLQACVHAFIDGNDGTVYQTLPWTKRGWHAGGSANDTHIGVEMCEPSEIKYTSGASFTVTNAPKARECVERTYTAAVELFAYLCKTYNLDPLGDGVIISHNEGYKRGVAYNHSDPEHLWRGLNTGYTMDRFRADVKKALGGTVIPTTTVSDELYRVRKSWSDSKSQIGAYKSLDNAKVRADLNPGYKVYNSSGVQVYPADEFMVRVTIDGLYLREGPGIRSYRDKGFIPRGAYTIVETRTGEGYTWGRLKSGAGWIALEYTERI